MDEYKKLCEELEKTYMTYALTGNKESHIAKILLKSAAAINALSTENARLNKQIDIAEHEIIRRDNNIGQWEEVDDGMIHQECGFFIDDYYLSPYQKKSIHEGWNFCPNCGTRMVQE